MLGSCKEPGRVARDLTVRRYVRRDHGPSVRHRLQNVEPEAFVHRSAHEDAPEGVKRTQLRLRYSANVQYSWSLQVTSLAIRQPARRAGNDQSGVRELGMNPREGRNEGGVVLARFDGADRK